MAENKITVAIKKKKDRNFTRHYCREKLCLKRELKEEIQLGYRMLLMTINWLNWFLPNVFRASLHFNCVFSLYICCYTPMWELMRCRLDHRRNAVMLMRILYLLLNKRE